MAFCPEVKIRWKEIGGQWQLILMGVTMVRNWAQDERQCLFKFVLDAPVTWNFQKFMIDESGYVVGSVKPKTGPDTEEILEWIKGGKD
ncbi:MAG: hypothetical protein ABJB16_00810 [Saprospiraceae bacterium]